MRSRILFMLCFISVLVGQPTFTAHDITTSANGASSVYTADLDNDGDMDVLSSSENDAENGIVEINTSFLGSDSVSVSGTGSLASIVFQSMADGESSLNFDAACEFVDPDDSVIEIKGFGVGVVNAQ